MAKKAKAPKAPASSVQAVETLNRKALESKKGTQLSDMATTVKAPVPAKAAPAKKAPAKKEGPSASTIAHRRLLIAVSAIVKYGAPEDMEKAARSLFDAAAHARPH